MMTDYKRLLQKDEERACKYKFTEKVALAIF